MDERYKIRINDSVMKTRTEKISETAELILKCAELDRQINDANSNGRHDIADGKTADLICVLGAARDRLSRIIEFQKIYR